MSAALVATPDSINLSPYFPKYDSPMSPLAAAISEKSSYYSPNGINRPKNLSNPVKVEPKIEPKFKPASTNSLTYNLLKGNFDEVFTPNEQDTIRNDFAFAKDNNRNIYDTCFMFALRNGEPGLESTSEPIMKKFKSFSMDNKSQKIAYAIFKTGTVKPISNKYRLIASTLDSFAIRHMMAPENTEETSMKYKIDGKILQTELLIDQADYVKVHMFYCIVYALVKKFA